MIEKMFLTPNRYSRPQTRLNQVRGIVVHYVGNPGSSARANRNYFESLKDSKKAYASSHYIIGLDGEIIQCVPENEIAYASNERNADTISIECCHPDKSGKFNQKTRDSLIRLCADISLRYSLNPLKDIIRHFDVTGKKCPLYWVNDTGDFYKFKTEVKEYMETIKKLQNDIKYLNDEVYLLKQERQKVYSTIEDVPMWARNTIEKLIKKGVLTGSEKGLDLSYDMLRIFVILDREGVFDKN